MLVHGCVITHATVDPLFRGQSVGTVFGVYDPFAAGPADGIRPRRLAGVGAGRGRRVGGRGGRAVAVLVGPDRLHGHRLRQGGGATAARGVGVARRRGAVGVARLLDLVKFLWLNLSISMYNTSFLQ